MLEEVFLVSQQQTCTRVHFLLMGQLRMLNLPNDASRFSAARFHSKPISSPLANEPPVKAAFNHAGLSASPTDVYSER